MTRPLSLPRTLCGTTLALCLSCSGLAHAQESPSAPLDPPHALALPARADGGATLSGSLDHADLTSLGEGSGESADAPHRRTVGSYAHPRASVWHDLFTGTVSDARRFPSRQTLGWLAIGAVAAASTRPADSHVGRSLSSASKLEEPFEPGAVIGSTPLQLGMSAATYALGRAAGWPHMTMVAADLFRAELLAQGLTMGVKESVRRRRPEGSGFAFPSGHTTVSFASATVLQQHLGWRMGAPAYALATYVALSRVQMKRHYLSDVAFGAALGIAAGRTVTLGHEKRMHLSPMATAGGAGVQFTWIGKP